MEDGLFSLAVALVALATALIFFVFSKKKEVKTTEPPPQPKKEKKKEQKKPLPKKKPAQKHPREICSLKQHTSPVLDLSFSPNGEMLATTSSDRSVRVWWTEHFEAKNPKSIKVNIPFDHGTGCVFSEDSELLFVPLDLAREIAVIKIGKQCSIQEQLPLHHKDKDILSISAGMKEKYFLTCGSGEELVFSNRKGELLEKFATKQFHNYKATVSKDGQYAMAATFSSDVKIYQITEKGKVEVKKLMSLLGHKGSVLSCDFTHDSKSAVTSSRDHTWKLWKLDIEYQGIANPDCLLTVTHPEKDKAFDIIRASPDGKKVAALTNTKTNTTIYIYSLKEGKLLDEIKGVHTQGVSQMVWGGERLFTCAGREVKVWRID